MFDDHEKCGLGGWGDPNDDIQITTGGFKDVVRVYPSPHRIRRNFTLQPLANIPNPFPNDPLAPPVDPTILINGSFSSANYDFLLNGFLGDFRGFQAYIEGPQVRGCLVVILRCLRYLDMSEHRAHMVVRILFWEAI
jgi:tyrosinase